MKSIYLDNHSTTPLDPNVFLSMQPWFLEKIGNPSSRNHIYGWEAAEAVELARESIAEIINASARDIIFTSGATDSNNIALQGVMKNSTKHHIITLKTEHKAVLDIFKEFKKVGHDVTFLSVKKNGLIDLDKLQDAIKSNTYLISIMHINNEIGVEQPISNIGEICRENNIIFHVDAAQSLGKVHIDVSKLEVDLLSISSHKIYGPKGIGALFIKGNSEKIDLKPIKFGGGHEKNLNPGTLAVPNIVGFGDACQIAQKLIDSEKNRISKLRDALLAGILNENPKIKVNGCLNHRVSGNLNITIPDNSNEELIARMPEISISTGSACTSNNLEPSHVLKAIGLSSKEAHSSLRFGIGRFNNQNDIEIAINCLNRSIRK